MAVNFDFQNRLGSGHFGEVWLATDMGLGIERALKLIHPTQVLNHSNFFQEAQILRAVEHANIVRVEETGYLEDGRIYVAMDYLPRGSLEDETKGSYLDLTRVKSLFIDSLRGLEHAHLQGIIHRDIKPGNILIGNNREGVLSDFGLAIPSGLNLRNLGAKEYAYILHLAPEVYTQNEYSVVTDIYACGVTLYRLVNGDNFLPPLLPFEIRARTIEGRFPDRKKYRDFIPRPLRILINRAMNIDPSKRFQSASQMRHDLEQINIEKNWREVTLTDGTKWTCGWNNRCYEVVRKRITRGNWSVTVKKGSSKRNLRIQRDISAEDLNKTEADRHSRRILQDYVLGTLN